jgi:hypothetical protein
MVFPRVTLLVKYCASLNSPQEEKGNRWTAKATNEEKLAPMLFSTYSVSSLVSVPIKLFNRGKRPFLLIFPKKQVDK